MKRICSFLLGVFCLAPLTLNSQTMSHEEEVVRNAYSKAALICALEPVSETGLDQVGAQPAVSEAKANKRLADGSPTFTLSDFETGSLININSDPWGKFVTMPQSGSEILSASVGTLDFSDAGNPTSWKVLRAAWQPFNISPASVKAEQQRSVADTIKIGTTEWSKTPVTYTRYAAYNVALTFQGKTVGPYKAIFFFGRDNSGQEVATPNDVISGQVIQNALKLPYYPTGLVSSSLRDIPSVAKWLRANSIPASSCAVSRQVCCTGGHCGISEADLNRDLAAPLPSQTPEVKP